MTIEFYPDPGDTIITRNGMQWICVAECNYNYGNNKNKAIYAHSIKYGSGSHMDWKSHNGMAEYQRAYDIVEVIPFKKKEDISLKIRALEFENAYLRKLLYKQGIEI